MNLTIPDVDVVSVERDVVLEEIRSRWRTQLETESSQASARHFLAK